MRLATLRPSPVSVTTPTMIPAAAQAAATPIAFLAPASSALMNILTLKLLFFLISDAAMATITETTIDQKAENKGVYPLTRKNIIVISGMRRYPLSLITVLTLGS